MSHREIMQWDAGKAYVLGVWLAGIYSIENKVGLDLFPVGGTGTVMQFTCGSTPVSIQGSVIVPIPANTMKLVRTLPYAQSRGIQKPESFIAEPRDVLEASFGEAPFEQSRLTMKTIQTNEEAVEINSTV